MEILLGHAAPFGEKGRKDWSLASRDGPLCKRGRISEPKRN